jgi:radical SAM superfamily enzyme YgiQ (UPF0313 family)
MTPTSEAGSSNGSQRRASKSMLVSVDLTGIVIPQYGDHPKLPLGLTELRVLEGLTNGAIGSGSTADASFLAALVERGLVVDGPNDAQVGSPVAGEPEVHEDGRDPAPDPPMLVLPNPVLLRCHDGHFESVNHDGDVRLALSADELVALAQFRLATDTAGAYAAYAEHVGPDALSESAFHDLVRRALGAQLLVAFHPDQGDADRQAHQTELMRQGMRAKAGVTAAFDRFEAAADPDDASRVPVIGVHTNWASAPAGLGAVLAHARGFDDGALHSSFDFRPRLVWDEVLLRAAAERAGVYLFSNYVWNHDENMRLSAVVKQVNPQNVTIHGGPNTPKYGPDVERFFREHPHVDVAVHGEGEQTFAELLAALRGHVGDGPPDLAPLDDVAGLSYRGRSTVVTTGSRDRVTDLNVIPSAILTGLFDGFIPAGPLGGVALETNRGCPYGCTFCDWGSATLSRIRKFDLDRIFAELEWCARNQVQTVGIADANFGVFERDVEIAEKIAELKATYGYPKNIGNNYAKNTVKHLSKIIEIFTEAGIVAEGKMSMQSFDDETLAIIRRKNIKVEKYDELAVEFRRNRLPLSVDLMLGLPGSTPETFKNDLQACVDRDVRALIQPTMLLPNSPMNEPEYRAEHGIVAQPGEYVQETASYTRDEWNQMHRLGAGLWLFENFGILRQVASYVRGETGCREVDFYEALIEASDEDPESWPFTAIVVRVLPHAMVPPVSWRFFLDEIRRWLVTVEGMADDSALDTVLEVQHALLPARDRTFPLELSLAHDYVTWRRIMLEARDGGHEDWPTRVAPLRSFGPGTITIDDPHQICTTALDGALTAIVHESSWDFDSPVSRPRQRGHDGDPSTTKSQFETAGSTR